MYNTINYYCCCYSFGTITSIDVPSRTLRCPKYLLLSSDLIILLSSLLYLSNHSLLSNTAFRLWLLKQRFRVKLLDMPARHNKKTRIMTTIKNNYSVNSAREIHMMAIIEAFCTLFGLLLLFHIGTALCVQRTIIEEGVMK